MTDNCDRRHFIQKSLLASMGATLGLSLEEKILAVHDLRFSGFLQQVVQVIAIHDLIHAEDLITQ